MSLERDPRVYFAAERTMLAWVRTGIALMGFGFVVARFGLFLREMAFAGVGAGAAAGASAGATQGADNGIPRAVSLWIGTSLIVLGVWVNLAAAVRHFRYRRQFERGEPFVTPKGLMLIILSVLLALVGIAMTTYLAVVGRT